MKVDNFLTLKDFFNYFVAGFIWLTDFYLIIYSFTNIDDLKKTLFGLQSNTNLIDDILFGIILIIFPFLIGFILNPIGEVVTEWVRKKGGDAIKWVTNTDHKLNEFGLSTDELSQVNTVVAEMFDIKNKPLSEWFYQIRAYIMQKGGGAVELSIRALDLTNFCESILVPVPLFFLIVSVKLLIIRSYFYMIASLMLGIGAFWFISRRYLYLRGYWVKHVYRAFLAIEVDKRNVE